MLASESQSVRDRVQKYARRAPSGICAVRLTPGLPTWGKAVRSLADELIHETDSIVQQWYERWCRTGRFQAGLSEAALKDKLPLQLRIVGEQLRQATRAEDPETMWKVTERLDPEERVEQDVPIEEVVQEYRIAVDTVRDWIEERRIEVPFTEYSYFYAAMFELTAESVRRYAAHQAERVRKDRGRYLAGLMHQLRTPLSALSMQVERLDRGELRPDAGSIAKLRQSLRRVTVLVDGVLRLERLARVRSSACASRGWSRLGIANLTSSSVAYMGSSRRSPIRRRDSRRRRETASLP